MYKVFINDTVIYFTNDVDFSNNSFNHLKMNFFHESLGELLYNLISRGDIRCGVIICVEDVESVFNQFKSLFKPIKAAGGVVKNEENKTLFIYRLDKWDLPKGKMEDNESIEETAIREVEEECGITNLKLGKPLQDTFHIYKTKKNTILKQTHWFEMTTNFTGKLIPQLEEGITKVEWLSDSEINDKVLKNTYSSIASLLG